MTVKAKLKKVGQAVNTKTGFGVVGGLAGAGAFGITLFAAPNLVAAAAAPVATLLAHAFGQTTAVFLASMGLVGLAAVLATALLAVVVKLLVDHFMNAAVAAKGNVPAPGGNVPAPVVTGSAEGGNGLADGGNVPAPVVTGSAEGGNVPAPVVTGSDEENDGPAQGGNGLNP